MARYHVYQGIRMCMWTTTREWELEFYSHFIWRQFLRAHYLEKARCILALLSICNWYLEKLSIKNLEPILLPAINLCCKYKSLSDNFVAGSPQCAMKPEPETVTKWVTSQRQRMKDVENSGWWHTITSLLPPLGGLIPGGILAQEKLLSLLLLLCSYNPFQTLIFLMLPNLKMFASLMLQSHFLVVVNSTVKKRTVYKLVEEILVFSKKIY